jgi:hypothetical protein
MITRAEAEEIAAGWARSESEARGYLCSPMVSEFDLGFVVWTREPASVRPNPGDGVRTVIDRETGATEIFPTLPPAEVANLYRSRRSGLAARRRTLDPAVELRRIAHRRPAPTTVAQITVEGRIFSARGAKGDQPIDHHPLVAEQLINLDPSVTVRGTERHAELIVCSDVLYEADRSRGAPLAPGEARNFLAKAALEIRLIRDLGDPRAGSEARPCESCISILVELGLLPWPILAFVEPFQPYSENIAQPGRFPDRIAGALAQAGWRPMPESMSAVLADRMIDDVVAVPGKRYRHRPFPVARTAIMDFPGVFCELRGPGLHRQVRWLTLDPMAAAHTADTLGDFGEVLGMPLFPLGVEALGDAIIAIDEQGRVFALDQGGEWFLGPTLDQALLALLSGAGPTPRVRDDGSWQ